MEQTTPKQLADLRDAVLVAGDLNHLGIPGDEFVEFISALAWYLGGSLDAVDAFLTEQPGTINTQSGDQPVQQPVLQHRVYWLTGSMLGSLALAKEDETHAKMPPRLYGWLRPLADIERIDLDSEFHYELGERTPEVRPWVQLHFPGDVIRVDVGARTNERAREQAADFVARLLEALARR